MKEVIIKQIKRVLDSCCIWDSYVNKLWDLFGENSEFASEEIINLSICGLFDIIVAHRDFKEFNGEFDIFEDILYETALKNNRVEYKTAQDIYNCFTNIEKVMTLCKEKI